MSRTSALRRAAVSGCAVIMAVGTVAAAPPASAGSMSFSKSSGRMVSAEWLEMGELPGAQGNAHFGNMQVIEMSRGRADIYGVVMDLQCPDGVIPTPPGGHHGPEEPANPCQVVDMRFIETGTARFTMDRKLSKATLTGNLAVVGHSGTGRPPVNMVLTGVGATTSSLETGRFADGTTSYSYRYSFTGRQATVSGSIGPMIFDNVPGEYSSAQMGAFRSLTRETTR